MRRGIAVLKMRGSWHEKQIREFTIDQEGMHIREQFVDVNGFLTGSPTSIHGFEQARLSTMFEPPAT